MKARKGKSHLRKLTVHDFSKSQDLDLSEVTFDLVRHSSSIEPGEAKPKTSATAHHKNFDKNSIFVSHNYKSTHDVYQQLLPRTISSKKFSEGANASIGEVIIIKNQKTGGSSASSHQRDT